MTTTSPAIMHDVDSQPPLPQKCLPRPRWPQLIDLEFFVFLLQCAAEWKIRRNFLRLCLPVPVRMLSVDTLPASCVSIISIELPFSLPFTVYYVDPMRHFLSAALSHIGRRRVCCPVGNHLQSHCSGFPLNPCIFLTFSVHGMLRCS